MTATTASGVPPAAGTTSGGGSGESAPTGNRFTGPPAVADALAPDPAAVSALWERERLLEERERIAADLHDHVIARLFAAALTLDRVVGTLGPGPLAAQLEVTVDGLDETIFQLRRMIGRLKQQTASDGDGAALAGRLLNLLTEVSPALGFHPVLRLTGLDMPLPEDIDEDLLAVLREALTNVARHAQAAGAEVEVAATVDRLTVKVTDDGTGMAAAPARRSGLDNLARRAHDRRGTFSAESLHRSGTQVTWTIPLD
jgi:signal transduction histidine kinase